MSVEDFPGDIPLPKSIGDVLVGMLPDIELSARVSKLTESPIETMLAVAILRQWENVELCAPGEGWGRSWTLIPQFPWRRYRVDLALRKPDGSLIFIECDGEEFHSTPDQIQRDEARQLEMEEAGIPVVRFTGSEINYDAVACVSDLWRFRRWGE